MFHEQIGSRVGSSVRWPQPEPEEQGEIWIIWKERSVILQGMAEDKKKKIVVLRGKSCTSSGMQNGFVRGRRHQHSNTTDRFWTHSMRHNLGVSRVKYTVCIDRQ